MLRMIIAFSLFIHTFMLKADCVSCEKKLSGHDVSSVEKLAQTSEQIARQVANKEKGIWGEFYLKQLCGSIYAPAPYSKNFPLNATHKDLGEVVSFKIAADGLGKVEASKVCKFEVPNQLEFDKQINGRRASLISLGTALYSVFSYFKNLKENECTRGSQVKGNVSVNPARNFFGGKLDSITANVGFYKTKPDPQLANKACAQLYASQFVNFGDKLSCIGYKNKQMDEIHLYTVIPPDPYLTRMIFRQKHNFNQGSLASCKVPLEN